MSRPIAADKAKLIEGRHRPGVLMEDIACYRRSAAVNGETSVIRYIKVASAPVLVASSANNRKTSRYRKANFGGI
jgi:hypothetical protein